MQARDASGAKTIYEAENVSLHDFDSDKPKVRYVKDGIEHELTCDFIAGCDGYHGVARASVPEGSSAPSSGSIPSAGSAFWSKAAGRR